MFASLFFLFHGGGYSKQLCCLLLLFFFCLYGLYSTHAILVFLSQITHDIRLDERPEYQRAIVSVTNEGKIQAQSTDRNQMSSRMVTMLGANSLLVLPGRTAERSSVASGDKIECLLIGKLV